MTTSARYLMPVASVVAVMLFACKSPTPPPLGASGEQIYELQLCANCHKDDGRGGSLGPPLRSLAQHWNRKDLANFLAVPSEWSEDPRIAKLSAEYSAEMSPYDNLSEDERLRLTDLLLSW